MSTIATRRPSLAVRLITVLMFFVQAVTIWYLKGSIAFPVVLSAAMTWVVFNEGRWHCDNSTRLRVCAVLAVLFVIKSRVAPVHLPAGAVTPMTQFAHAAAQFFLIVQVLLVFSSRHREVLPQLLPWLGALTMVCTGDLRVTEIQRVVFQTLVLIYVMLAASFSALNRQIPGTGRAAVRSGALGVLLAATAGLGWWGSAMLYDHSRDIENLISNLIDPNTRAQESGFAAQGHLRSVVAFRNTNADAIAMRVYSKSAPGYLRGYVFTEYFTRSWGADQASRAVLPSLLAEVTTGEDENAFFIAPDLGRELDNSMEFWPMHEQDATLFLPDRAVCLVAAAEAVTLSGAGNVASPGLPSGYPYTVHLAAEPFLQELTETERRACLETGAAPAVTAELAAKLVSPEDSFENNIRTVCDYFHENFEYSDQTEAAPGADPIEWFLTEGHKGHCEYFASAAALILRAGGIPTRYVTGFVAVEQNGYGDYWVVRNRYAHAWVQAWDDERQRWVIVEATPGSGVPEAGQSRQFADLWNYILDRYQVFRVRLHQRGMLWALGALVNSHVGKVIIGGLLAWLCLVLRRRLRARRHQVRPKPDSRTKALARLLVAVDAKVKRRHGLERAADETLHQFAARIAATAADDSVPDWYRAYAVARYSPATREVPGELQATARSI